MSLRSRVFVPVLLLMMIAFLMPFATANAQNCKTEDECKKQIAEYEQKLSGIREEKNTLSSQVQYFDTQIYLTGLRITDAEQKVIKLTDEVESLSGKIEGLDTSLNYVSKLLIQKIAEDYKRRDVPFINLVIDPGNASALINRMKYAKTAQENDQRLAVQVQQAKLNFEDQKTKREEKALELEQLNAVLVDQKAALDSQKAVKQRLLSDTQNDEQKYQSLLAGARAEFAAIQGIVSGGGTETKMRTVTKGEAIASIIAGASCNSSASHLHFIVQEGSGTISPFSRLKPVSIENCSGSSCGAGDGDPTGASGDWDWPIPPTIKMFQGYGSTWAVRNSWVGSIYNFHNGIDIIGASNTVTAVADGTLYRGSYSVGCTLSYVKLQHKDSNLSTLYLHVYPQ
jgi:peptidoglycan hydrolase CwlO-like protein